MAHDATPPRVAALTPEERRQYCSHIVELDRPGLMRLVGRYEATVYTQAARLAAVDTLLHSRIAECCGAQLGQRSCESFGCPDLQEIRDMLASGAPGAPDVALARATRLAALEAAARAWEAATQAEVLVYDSAGDDWPERMGAAHRVREAAEEHLHAVLRALAAPTGETRSDDVPEVCKPCQRGDHWRCVFNGGYPCGCSVRPSEWGGDADAP